MRRRRSLHTASASPEARCALEAGRIIQLRPDAKDTQTTALPGSHLPAPRREHTVLHQVIAEHWEVFLRAVAEAGDGASLAQFVEREFWEFLTCGVFEH